MNSNRWRVLIGAMALLLLVAAEYRTSSPNVMTETARAFLSTLTPEQRGKATFNFNDDERFNWHFIPKVRKGLPFTEMNSQQKHLASTLLSAGLSQQGYIKAKTIMSLEDILRILEKDTPQGRRNPDGYFFSVFGEPSDSGTWGYRVEGHHVALNYTIAKGRVASTPNFWGSNPAEVKDGPRQGLRPLGRQEDIARELLMSLTPEQKKVAVVASEAYKDIITMASRKAALQGQPNGLSAAKMNSKQRQILARLVEEYASDFPPQIAEHRMEQLKKAGTNLQFAWAGVEQRGGPHYYRVQASAFLIEYDNTQNNANHVHSVWRDYEGDFGLDLLKDHYQTSHR